VESKICELIKTVSFSSLTDWKLCPFYYKLVNIDKLRTFTKNIWTVYGGLLHRHVQAVLMDKVQPDVSAKKFERVWRKFCGIYSKQVAKDLKEGVDPKKFSIPAITIILNIKDKFTEQYGTFKVLETEEWLREKCFEEFSQSFVGCLDIAIQLQDGSIVIADFKSCESNYAFNKFKDKYKDYQLVLYKHFYARKHNIDPGNIETFFITMERNPNSKNPLKFCRVTSGGRKVKNAIAWLQSSLEGINGGRFLRNKMACYKFGEKHPCAFCKTPYCK